MADILPLPGILYRPDPEFKSDVKSVLDSAADAGLKDVAVVGRGVNGVVEVFGSNSDADQTIGLLTRGIAFLSALEQIDEPDEDV